LAALGARRALPHEDAHVVRHVHSLDAGVVDLPEARGATAAR
jgi:hypothetical protein